MSATQQLLAAQKGAASDPTAASIRSKLVSWWEMGEASGTRSDSKGANHLSNIAGTVSTGTGLRGGGDVAVSLAGTGGLYANDSASLSVPSGGGDHCIFGWAYVTTSANMYLFAKWEAGTASSMEYALDWFTDGKLYAQNGGTTYYNVTATEPALNTWFFVVVWRDSADGKVRIQVNNGTVYASTSASNPSDTASALGFGQIGSTTNNRLSGRLQRWGWAKGAILTSGERTWLYNSGSGRTYAELAAA